MNEEIIMVDEEIVEQEVEQTSPDEVLDETFVKKLVGVAAGSILVGTVTVVFGKRIVKTVGSWIDKMMAKHLKKKGWDVYFDDEDFTTNEDVCDAE